ncbi:SMG7-like protein isoform X1 [Tanacetum coccineum]
MTSTNGPNDNSDRKGDTISMVRLDECKLFITRFIAVMIFTVHNANKETENHTYAENLQRSVVLQNEFTAVFDFMALIVERCFEWSSYLACLNVLIQNLSPTGNVYRLSSNLVVPIVSSAIDRCIVPASEKLVCMSGL